jgi:hypothetical protein
MSTTLPPIVSHSTPASDGPAAPPFVQRDFRNLVVAPAIQKSLDAFRAALPELLKNKTPDQEWVAFCGDELITFGRTKTEAYQECFRRGLKFGTFIVWSIEPGALNDQIKTGFLEIGP